MTKGYKNKYDIIIIGGGHAGVEAALSSARLGKSVLLLTMSLDAIAFMACNPSVGGTAKGHLVREIDCLGGEMGLIADANLLQLRMLNLAKGPAVHSLRGQADKTRYHLDAKMRLENTENLTILEAEATSVITNGNTVCGVATTLSEKFFAPCVIVATGVYLNSEIIVGDYKKTSGPSGFGASLGLSDSLTRLGFDLRRFKTGTPARVNKNSLDFSKMSTQNGDENIYPFSMLTDGYIENKKPCYLTYTNQKTHDIIKENLHKSPMYNGNIKGTGARYCPSIEDKVMRFADKDRHQLFIEPESAFTNEMYVQGLSTSMPKEVQQLIYQSIEGMENVEIMRYAYAIEYDCIDSTTLYASLMSKNIDGLFFAGQINGTSGYEEAAAQGLIAGINASLYLDKKQPFVLGRDSSYIGVLIDDLVTKGTNEPYRMMTARAEYRLSLRQENADLRLTPHAISLGLACKERIERYNCKIKSMQKISNLLQQSDKGLSLEDKVRKNQLTAKELKENFPDFAEFDYRHLEVVETDIKYSGYLKRQDAVIKEQQRMENAKLSPNIDYMSIGGLRIEARQKLTQIKPLSLGQASRISGVSPADIAVLMVYLGKSE